MRQAQLTRSATPRIRKPNQVRGDIYGASLQAELSLLTETINAAPHRLLEQMQKMRALLHKRFEIQ